MKMMIAGNKCSNCKHYRKSNYVYSKVKCMKRNKFYISMQINCKDFENIEDKNMKQTKSEKINTYSTISGMTFNDKITFNSEEHKANVELHLSLLGLPYYNNKKIKWSKHEVGCDRLVILFPLPRNSLFELVEFCKLNQINISFDGININLDFVNGFKQNYDKVI